MLPKATAIPIKKQPGAARSRCNGLVRTTGRSHQHLAGSHEELRGDHVGAYMLSKRLDEEMATCHLYALNIKQEFQEAAGGSSTSLRSSRSSRSSSPLRHTSLEQEARTGVKGAARSSHSRYHSPAQHHSLRPWSRRSSRSSPAEEPTHQRTHLPRTSPAEDSAYQPTIQRASRRHPCSRTTMLSLPDLELPYLAMGQWRCPGSVLLLSRPARPTACLLLSKTLLSDLGLPCLAKEPWRSTACLALSDNA